MAIQNLLIMNLLRIITPEEIGDIATKHNGGKFLALTDLVNERVERNIHRDFSHPDSLEEIHESHAKEHQAKILPFKKSDSAGGEEVSPSSVNSEELVSLTGIANDQLKKENHNSNIKIEHKEDENMSSFILIEKARLNKSQRVLKQKEIIDLYQKNSSVDVEQIKGSNENLSQAREAGVLINKKQY